MSDALSSERLGVSWFSLVLGHRSVSTQPAVRQLRHRLDPVSCLRPTHLCVRACSCYLLCAVHFYRSSFAESRPARFPIPVCVHKGSILLHAMTGVSRCGNTPRRRKRKQGNIKPRLKPSAALPTLCGRL